MKIIKSTKHNLGGWDILSRARKREGGEWQKKKEEKHNDERRGEKGKYKV
jgi:hypothetical protein